MAPTVVSGIRSTGVGIDVDRRVVEMADTIFQYDPNKTPFLTLLSGRLQKQVTGNPVFNHLEDEPLPSSDTLNANLSNGSTTSVTVSNGAYFRGGDICLLPTSVIAGVGEIIKVTSVASNVLTVTRDFANVNSGTGGTAALSGDVIMIIGNANEENTTVRTILSTTEVTQTNYTQIIRTPFGASATLGGSKLYGGADKTYQRQKFATQHAFEIERTFLFGRKRETTGPSGTHKIRTTNGILSVISTNSVNANGTLTATTMETLCQKAFRYGSSQKLMMCSRTVASQIDLISEGRLETVVGADTYGVQLKRYLTTHGDLLLSIHDGFKDAPYTGYGVVVDLANVKWRYMQDDQGRSRDALLRTNIEDPSADGWVDEYLSEAGLHTMLEKTHAVLTGVS